MLVCPTCRRANTSRSIPATKASINKKRFLIKIVRINRQMRTSGSMVTVPSRKIETMRRKRKKKTILTEKSQIPSATVKRQRDFQLLPPEKDCSLVYQLTQSSRQLILADIHFPVNQDRPWLR